MNPNDPIEAVLKEFREKNKEKIENFACRLWRNIEYENEIEAEEGLVSFVESVIRAALIATHNRAIASAVEAVEKWTRFSCGHTNVQHKDPDIDCPGWSLEEAATREVLLGQIRHAFKSLTLPQPQTNK